MKPYCLIMNPTAKSGKACKRWENIYTLLSKYQLSYEIYPSEYAGHSVVLAKNAVIENRFEAIIAVGGDGTINEVLTGMMQADLDGATLPPLGIVYTGTSPDICKYHKIPLDHEQAIKLIASKTSKRIDIGRVEYSKTIGGPSVPGWFLCSVNLGIGASVATGSNSGLRKIFGDLIGTFLSILWSIVKYQHADLSITIDGKDQTVAKVLNMTIGKNPLVASGVKVDVDIQPDDGRMYLASINSMGLLGILFNTPKIYDGTIYKMKKNTLVYVDEVKAAFNPLAPEVEFDGDAQGYLPCKIKILNNKLELIK